MALKSLSPWKAPGLNEFPPGFFQTNWDTIQCELCNMMNNLCNGHCDISPFNSTLLVLIPKSKNPKHTIDLRSISLCTTIYKILSKIICLQLKPIMPNLIHHTQGAFTIGQSALNNALIVHEILHSIITKDKRLANMGNLVLP